MQRAILENWRDRVLEDILDSIFANDGPLRLIRLLQDVSVEDDNTDFATLRKLLVTHPLLIGDEIQMPKCLNATPNYTRPLLMELRDLDRRHDKEFWAASMSGF
ncbi:MAG: hypothetical protein MMC33_006686 [Icmadophila ericetorum]|nr:hypothetical protein [Icmadophila ericetorum]